MRTASLALVIALLAATAGRTAEKSPNTFPRYFRLLVMPFGILEMQINQLDHGTEFSGLTGDAVLPVDVAASAVPEALLTAFTSRYAEAIGCTPRSVKPLPASGPPGREIAFAPPAGAPLPAIRARIFRIGDRLHLVEVRGSEAFVSSAQGDAILDAFRQAPGPPPPPADAPGTKGTEPDIQKLHATLLAGGAQPAVEKMVTACADRPGAYAALVDALLRLEREDALWVLGRALMDTGHVESAIGVFLKLAERFRDPNCYQNIARCYIKKFKAGDARSEPAIIWALRKQLELYVLAPSALSTLASGLSRKDPGEARRLANLALLIDPQETVAQGVLKGLERK